MTVADSFFERQRSSRWLRVCSVIGVLAVTIFVIGIWRVGISSQSALSTTVTYLPIINETLKLTSHVIVESNSHAVGVVRLTLTNLSTERPVPMEPTFLSIHYRDAQQQLEVVPWSWKFQGDHNNDTVLDQGEHVQISINLGEVLSVPLIANTPFMLELQSEDSAILRIHRTLPPQLSPLIDLQ